MSNFPKNNPSGIPTGLNKKVVGMSQDEPGGEIIDEFVGLRVKLYSYKMLQGNGHKNARVLKSLMSRRPSNSRITKDAC